MNVKIEITLDELRDSYDWAEVFGEGGGGNCNNETDACPPEADINCTPPTRADVVEIVAAVNGENDGPEWIGVFLLRDGRYLVAEGSCDYTGWDCQAGNTMQVAATLQDAIQFGLTPERQERLGLSLQSLPNTDRDAFLKALSENEDDVTTRMVYADWLDENGQPEEAERQRKWNGAKEWLTAYAVRVSPYDGAPDEWMMQQGYQSKDVGPDYAYRKFMEYVRGGEMFYHGSDLHGAYEVEEPDELYANLTILLGRQIGPDSFESFSCSC